MHLVHTNRAPQYLADLVQTVMRYSSRAGLRSSDTVTLLPMPSQSAELGSESAVSVTPGPLLGTVFQTTCIRLVTLVFLSAA